MTAPLEPAARIVDAELFAIETEIDWLTALSPTGNHERWEAFRASGYRSAPALTYPPLHCEPRTLRRRLRELPLEEIDHALVGELLREKSRELDRQVDLVELRGTDGFVQASVALFGAPDPALLADADEILAEVPEREQAAAEAGAADLVRAAEEEREAYRAQHDGFDFAIHVVDDLNSSLMVNRGELLIDAETRVPRARVAPLVAHEVGTHVVTRFNGRQQPLRQLESGLAHYDPLQEGLAALAEWLAGCLPADRLRVLAGRVVAADAAMQGQGVEEVFALLHETHGIGAHGAFDTAVRALRGGGLTKDAVYLQGLRDLLAYLADGHDIAPLFAGKLALAHLPALESLREEGLALPPALMPRHLRSEAALDQLEAARATSLTSFYTQESRP
ncbi:tyrosine/phenylalanine carboxypeptidase domain-containing protein [Roseitranquillus sediminis]|uniref:tyrosine/phenylalanine carboxypeptidase domain-containing protein n=1 Tax=Roseitranquillus sediminis TaxID=2809051 RepID=UPI001D0C0996|nr:tyrosine/phenylalanine carboxypeptidase domain-containing protein [Roseitranquillus sediminis]MBM9595876.1 DUF1704 domain-containing protein [Roseitranquillus sediminis]